MASHKQLQNEVRELSRETKEPQIRLTQTKDILREEIIRLKKIIKKKEKADSDLNALLTDKKYTEIFRRVRLGHPKYTQTQVTRIYDDILSNDDAYVLETTDESGGINAETFNEVNREALEYLLLNGFDSNSISQSGIGSDIIATLVGFAKGVLTVKKVVSNRNLVEQNGSFFPLYNTSDIDLTRYQIYRKTDKRDDENCLIYALGMSGISDTDLNSVKLAFPIGFAIARKYFNKVAEIIKHDIHVLLYCEKDNHVQRRKYELESNTKYIEIALYKNHYFIQEETIYSGYSIKNYESIKNKDEFYDYYEQYSKSKTQSKMSSLRLMIKLNEMKYFSKGDMKKSVDATHHIDIRDDIYLDNIKDDQRASKIDKIKKNKTKIFYGDCEAFVGESVKRMHELYLIGCVDSETDEVKIYNVCDFKDNQQAVWQWLSETTNNGTTDAVVYFHSLKYDYNILKKYLNVFGIVEKDNDIYSVSFHYKKAIITLKDSKKIIPMALGKFAKSFNLPKKYAKRSANNYNYFSRETDNKTVPIERFSCNIPLDELDIFAEIIGDKTEFNPTEYYIDYLKLDCLCLKYGMLEFNKTILDITDNKISVFDALTISSITDKYMYINGAYSGVYEIKGNLRDYVSRAVYGGRVHVNEKYKKQVIEEEINDFDGVSLYPSAISRLCSESGLPKGAATRMTDMRNWRDNDYCIMTVQITRVRKKQQMPFIAVKHPDSLEYTNKYPKKPVIIDKLTLEDYIQFHEIDYEVLDGVCWNSGYNNKMGGLIEKLFKRRLEAKSQGLDALQLVLKLMLNAAYGKTMTKKQFTTKAIVRNDSYTTDAKTGIKTIIKNGNHDNYICKNMSTIRSESSINERVTEFTQSCCDISYNRGHCGVNILSMSKRIMNEVMDVANTHKLKIYYQDTDSMHITNKSVSKLAKEFKKIKKYGNRNIIGKQLGQFHCDFNLDGAASEIYSTKSIFLGKKSYIDCLESKDKDGNTITGHHIRLKGITEAGITHQARYNYDSDPFEMFKDMAKGKELKFRLNPFDVANRKENVSFDFTSTGIKTRLTDSYIRRLKF